MYKTEALIQKSIKDSGVPTEELFIVSKAWPTQYGSDGIRKSLRKSLTELGVDYIGKILVRISMSKITRSPESERPGAYNIGRKNNMSCYEVAPYSVPPPPTCMCSGALKVLHRRNHY